MEILFLIGRILFGGYFAWAGINHFRNSGHLAGYAASKGVPQPKLAVIGSGIIAFLGGLGILVGIYMQIALWLIVVFLVPVTFMMHAFWKQTDPMAKMNEMIAFQKNLALVGAALMLLPIATAIWPLAIW